MNSKKQKSEDDLGKLPGLAPLANPYVPFQMENPVQYDADKGIIRGTLYPGLDLPFMGMVNKKHLVPSPLSDLQALAFAIQELTLYLDTHQQDEEALDLLQKYQHLYHSREAEFEKQYGPLTNRTPIRNKEYLWLNDPWPWEYCGNKEGK